MMGKIPVNMSIEERIDGFRKAVKNAAERVGRKIEDITIIAVSKGFPPEKIEEARQCGMLYFGENRVQEAKYKIPLCSTNIQWHMVGHLQSNKVRDAVRLFTMIHSVDSFTLLDKINNEAGKIGKIMQVCLQVNVSGEKSKSGMEPDEVLNVVEKSNLMSNITLKGLMTIPPYSPDPEDARPFFIKLREIAQLCVNSGLVNEMGLSIGMSEDFEVAIEEGAKWIRIGRAIFGDRPPKKVYDNNENDLIITEC